MAAAGLAHTEPRSQHCWCRHAHLQAAGVLSGASHQDLVARGRALVGSQAVAAVALVAAALATTAAAQKAALVAFCHCQVSVCCWTGPGLEVAQYLAHL